MTQSFQTGHSGVLAYNLVTREVQSTHTNPDDDEGTYWWHNPNDTYVVPSGRANRWENCYWWMEQLAAPETPKFMWDGNEYASIAAFMAAFGPSGSVDAGDVNLVNCIAGYETDSATVDPLPITSATLNPSLTTKSVYVRGITDVLGDADGNAVALASLPIGYSPLRASE